jgi:hypothetical protein
VHRLIFVVLTIELDEEPEVRPGQVDLCNELIPPVRHDELSHWVRQLWHAARQLHHACLEQAAGCGSASRAKAEDAADAWRARRARSLELRKGALELLERDQPLAKRGFECLLPFEVTQ